MRQQPVNIIGGAYTDDALPWSCQDTVNLLPVAAEAAGTRTPTKLSTPPGLRPWVKIGDGADYAIRGMRDVEGKLFVVSGAMLYQISNTGIAIPRGGIPGVGRVSMAHNQITGGNELLVVNGDSGFVWNTVDETFTKITDEGYPGAFVADFIDGYLAQVEPFGRFWFHSDLASALDYNTIDRYEAESSPDRIVALLSDHLEVWVFGERTAEIFANTGAGTGTFQSKRISIEKGCAGQYTPAKLDNGVAWLGSDGVVYQAQGYNPVRISTRAIESAIAGQDWSKAFAFTWADRGHEVYYLTFPSGQTFGYDASQRQWHRRASWHPVYDIARRWRVNAIARHNGQWIAGDYRSGELYVLDWDYPREGDTDPLVRERVGGVMHSHQNRVSIPFAEVIVEAGGKPVAAVEFPVQPQGPTISGDAPDWSIASEYPTYEYAITAGDSPIASIDIVSGQLPAGLALSGDGAISGTPTEIGTDSFTVRVTDEAGLWAELGDSIAISGVWWVTSGQDTGSDTGLLHVSADAVTWGAQVLRSPAIAEANYGPKGIGHLRAVIAGISATENGGDIEVVKSLQTSGGVAPTIEGGFSDISHVRYVDGIAFIINHSSLTYFYSTDHGNTWEAASIPSEAATVGLEDIARLDSGLWVGLGSGNPARFVYSDEDVPTTWTVGAASNGGSPGDAADFMVSSGSAVVSFANDQNVMRSTDGIAWTKLATGLANTQDRRDGIYVDGVMIASVAQRGSIVRSTDDGLTWSEVFLTGVQTTAAVRRLEYGNGVLVAMQSGPGPYFTSADLGLTWTSRTPPLGEPRMAYLT